MKSRLFSGFGLAMIWLVTSILVFAALDAMATREIPLEVEQFRRSGMSDAEVVAAAVQEARMRERNAWWIHNRETVLLFDQHRSYRLDSLVYDSFDLHLVAARGRMIGKVTLNEGPIYP